jgi:DNA repair protein RadA/Sms
MLLAVLDARVGLDFGRHDVFLNVAGGLRITEPAADLAAAAALCSSLFDRALPRTAVVFGEVALSGAVRPVNQSDARLKEASKLGFSEALAPAGARADGLAIVNAETLSDLLQWVRGRGG